MIRIQKLKEPKRTSGERLEKGKKYSVRGVTIINGNSFPIYVDTFERKGREEKSKKVSKKSPKSKLKNKTKTKIKLKKKPALYTPASDIAAL